VCAFLLMQCWNGLTRARVLARMADAPQRAGASCPSCHTPPPTGEFWTCPRCKNAFDMFSTPGVCQNCGAHFGGTACFECGRSSPLKDWLAQTGPTMDV
jgi:hypothetical protein